MTKREGAVLSAHTGTLLCDTFSNVNEYIEEIMERPVWAHEIPGISEEIKKRSEEEFIKIISQQY